MAGNAIAAHLATLTYGASGAGVRASAIYICLTAVFLAVLALTRDARMRADVAGAGEAIGVNLAIFAHSARGTHAAAAIHIRFRSVLSVVGALSRIADEVDPVAGVAGAVGVACTGNSQAAARRTRDGRTGVRYLSESPVTAGERTRAAIARGARPRVGIAAVRCC